MCVVCLVFALPSYAEKLRLRECPAAVRKTIEENLLGGKVDEIKVLRINDHTLYLVEINLKGFKDAKLYVSGDGTLRKTVVEIRLQDLPEGVRHSVERLVKRRAQIDDIEKEIIEGEVHYRVELDRPKQSDRIVVFEEDGTIFFDK